MNQRINPCSCGAQPTVKKINEPHFKFAAYCAEPLEKCQDWMARFGVTKEEATQKWNEAHPIIQPSQEDNEHATG